MVSTSPSLPRQRRREKRIREILATAMRLVTDHGLEALTVGRLADELDYTPGALYRYFRSKDAILAELQRGIIADFHHRLTRSLAAYETGTDTDTVDAATRALGRVLVAAELHRGLAFETPAQYRLVSMMLADPRPLLDASDAGPPVQAFVALLVQVAETFQLAQAARALRDGDPVERAIVFLASVQGVMQLGKLSRFAPQLAPRELTAELGRTLLCGWGADPVTLTRAGLLVGLRESEGETK